MASWVRKFSLKQKIYNEKVLDKAVELYEKYGKGFTKCTEEYNKLELIIKHYKFKDEEERFDYFVDKKIEIDDRAFNLYDNTEKMIKEIKDFQEYLSDIFIKDNYNFKNKKDMQAFSFRYINFFDRATRNLYSFIKDAKSTNLTVQENIKELFWEIRHQNHKRILDQKKQEQQERKKIFDYKEMIKLANRNGYEHRRTTGDHLILQHKESQKIIVIPAHELGHGLMLEIQKQIRKNKIA